MLMIHFFDTQALPTISFNRCGHKTPSANQSKSHLSPLKLPSKVNEMVQLVRSNV
jgi:hypothetical protein